MKAKNEKLRGTGIESRLAAYGEAFMKMFDDYDEKDENINSKAADSEGESDHSMSAEEPFSDSDDGGAKDAATGSGQQAVEEVVFSLSSRKASNASATSSGKQPTVGRAAQHAGQVDAATLRLMRKKFMSSKAKDIFADVDLPTAQDSSIVKDEEDMGGLTPEEFQKLQQEVELYGAKGLDKKQQKRWKAEYLQRLGAKAEKAPRVAGAIGKGLSQKRNEREKRAIEEAIESGMMQRKGMGKKKKAMQAKQRDKGLQEAGANFKNGILRISKKSMPLNKPGPKKGRRQRLPNF